ncbi:MAG: hypothetical protein JXA60_01835 [Candidatus Coatesbacteria bacterium]|nr:hypothetical protein [Candidatus Coatesbacteria bacterium]
MKNKSNAQKTILILILVFSVFLLNCSDIQGPSENEKKSNTSQSDYFQFIPNTSSSGYNQLIPNLGTKPPFC